LDFLKPILSHYIPDDRARQGEHFGAKYMGFRLNLYSPNQSTKTAFLAPFVQ
jgi:hypothetical protein